MPMQDYRRSAGMLQTGARILLVPGCVIAIAIMIKGYADVGDGFSAGVIAALAVLLQGLAFGSSELDRLAVVRLAPGGAFVGLGLALTTVFVPPLFGEPIFRHWPPAGEQVTHFGALEFITPVLFDVGVFLIVYGFCVGAVHAIAREQERQRKDRSRIVAAHERQPSPVEVAQEQGA